MKLKIFKNIEELNDYAAKEIVSQVLKKPDSKLGLATGSSPIGIYEKLVKYNQNDLVSFKHVHTINLDEYCGLNEDNDQSYIYFMKTNLFNHIDIDINNIHIPDGMNSDYEAVCDSYNEYLMNNTIDIQILGLGSNGHIGFNEPNTPFGEITHVVKLDEKTREDNSRFFNSIEEVPTHAITMGIKSIMHANKILLIAFGKGKVEALNGMINGEVNDSLPASILQLHPNIEVLTDQETYDSMKDLIN